MQLFDRKTEMRFLGCYVQSKIKPIFIQMIYQYKNPLSITSQFCFCGIPFRLDTYSGCSFGCLYCYSQKRGGNFDCSKINVANPCLIINRFKSSLEKPKKCTGIISQYIRRRMPLHFGGMSDPFQNLEIKEKVSLEVLEYLCHIKYPIVVSTKSTLLSEDPYIELIKSNPNLIVQYSFSTLKESLSKVLEPNCLPPQIRLESLKHLSENRIKTSIRWQPYIIGLSEHPADFVKKIVDAKIKHLVIEFLKLPIDNNYSWEKELIPLITIRDEYFQRKSTIIGRELILPSQEKIETIKTLKSILSKMGITLGVGDNDLQHLSDTNCCCGVDKFNGFENWNKFQFSYAVKNMINNRVEFSSILNQWKPTGAIDKYLNSKSRLSKRNIHNQVSDYIIDRWENLDSDFNPTSYFKVEYSGKKDENGLKIFNFDKKK